jgi:hypothetical protein
LLEDDRAFAAMKEASAINWIGRNIIAASID